MAIRKLDEANWHTYFDRVSDLLVGKRAEVEVVSLGLGDQIEAEWLPLLGIVYDDKDDIIEIALEDLDHLIRSPREVYIDDSGIVLTSLEIVDADGNKQIVQLRDPLMLPAPSSAQS